MAAPSEEQLICDKFNLEALTVNQVKVSKLWQTGKMFSLEPKRGTRIAKCILDPPRVERRGTRIVTLS
jgi:hypothetical protein